MTTATKEQFTPVPVDLTKKDQLHVGRAVELYARHLDELKERATKMRRSADAAKYDKEAEGLREELVAKLMNGGATIYARHLAIIAKGFEYLIINLRSAKGTLKPLGKDEWIDELDAEASDVEANLAPKFADQPSLKLEAPQATEEANRVEQEDAEFTKGTSRIGATRDGGKKPRNKKGKK